MTDKDGVPSAENPPGTAPAGAVGAETRRIYWRENIRLLGMLLAIWFAVSFGAGILFVDVLNKVALGGFPLGFWFAQQGSIYVFVALIFIYSARMRAIERRLGLEPQKGAKR
ncbi:DUF4212 domain-containing protein [Amphiplicatus metriothermophilus]